MRVLFSQGIISISKPRCGSTSVRRILDALVDPTQGDIAVDLADERPPYHPHLTAPLLKAMLRRDGFDIDRMTTVIVTRHPLDMLWSYYKYFQPDLNNRYNYQEKWDKAARPSFEAWVLHGKVGIHRLARSMAPEWVVPTDISPLSLEAHIDSRTGRREVNNIFRLEEINRFLSWLGERVGKEFREKVRNSSESSPRPALGQEALERVRSLFPLETRMYGL